MGTSHPTFDHPRRVLAVSDGIDEGTGQPIVCLTLRRLDGTEWACENYSLFGRERQVAERATDLGTGTDRVAQRRASRLMPSGRRRGRVRLLDFRLIPFDTGETAEAVVPRARHSRINVSTVGDLCGSPTG